MSNDTAQDDFYVEDEPVEDVLRQWRHGRPVLAVMRRRPPWRQWTAKLLTGTGRALERAGDRLGSSGKLTR